MRVGDEDMRHRLAAHRRKEVLDMLRTVGTRIDHRDPILADDVAAGSLEGEGPGIVRDDPPDKGLSRTLSPGFTAKSVSKTSSSGIRAVRSAAGGHFLLEAPPLPSYRAF